MAIHPYLDNTGREDAWGGGSRMIPITTPVGTFNVWTKRFGDNPEMKVLLLHGGPGASCEYLEAFDSFFPGKGIEYYHYDQLGSARSDQPDDPSLWEIDRFVEEVEQVRIALGLDSSNFFVLGQSWGGVLAIEYALKYQQHLKGMIISNMMSDISEYNKYATNVLMPKMDQEKLARVKAFEAAGDTNNPEYEELLMDIHYQYHVLRRPPEEWPICVLRGLAQINKDIYVPMQGPSELGASGKLLEWSRTSDLVNITVPTLVIGGEYDTMDPRYLEHMASLMPRGEFLTCPEGSHLAMYDDQEFYFNGLAAFLDKF